MSDYTEGEAIEYVDALLQETETLRDEAQHHELVHGTYLLPKLPPSLTYDEAVYVLSYDVMHEAREIKSRILGFEREIQCLASSRTDAGTVSKPDQSAVDNLERAGAVFLSHLDPNLTLRSRIIDAQLVQPLAIVILEMGAIDSPDPEKRFPWRAFSPELQGCGWLEADGIPTIFGRKYREFVHKAEQQYSGRKDGPEGPQARLVYENGKADWKKLSDDFTDRNMPRVADGGKFEACEQYWLDDGETIYHLVLDKASEGVGVGKVRFGKSSKRTGKIAWKGPNPFGRVSAFLCGSNVRRGPTVHDMYLPFLMDLIGTTEVDNVVQSIRASASRNRAAPRDYIAADPEFLKAYMERHEGQLPPPTEWPSGKTPIIAGEIKARPVDVDPDFEKLSQELKERRVRYTSAGSSTFRDPDVLEHSTAAGLLAGYEGENASSSIIVGPQDVCDRQMLEAFEHSVLWLADPANSRPGYACGPEYAKFSLRARGGELVSKKNLAAGESFDIDKDSFTVGHSWRVTTRQRTSGQAQAEYNAALERFSPTPSGTPGIGVYEDLYRAAGVADIDERKTTLAKENLMFEVVTPLVDDAVRRSLDYEIELDSGIRVGLVPALEGAPPGGGAAPPPNEAAPGTGPAPPVGSHTESPVVTPAEGGSGPAFQAG